MSYNTRRSGPQQPTQQASNVGQRRPMVTNNFVAAGQSAGAQKPAQQQYGQQQQQQQQQHQQQRPPQQQQAAQQASQIQFRQQQQAVKQPTPAQLQYNQQQQAQRTAQVAQQQRPGQAKPQPQPAPAQQQSYQTQSYQVKVEPATPTRLPVAAAVAAAPTTPAPLVPGANPPPPEINNGDSMDTSGDGSSIKRGNKPWLRGGKVSKREKLRRRNLRLSKMLQPKNAVMILNELVKNTQYTVEELDCKVDNNHYKAVVTFEGENHVGLGRSKILAKNAAAEAALKYLIKNKQLKLTKAEPADDPMDGSEGMELITEDGTAILPWQHVASFALFKLFSSWGEDPMQPVRQAQELLGAISTPKPAVPHKQEPKPAKQLPANPEKMNPIMLLHQMNPGLAFEEIGKNGIPPNVTFTINVSVNEQTFTGTGSSKKTAKKMAAYAACHNIYGINYPAEEWTPLS